MIVRIPIMGIAAAIGLTVSGCTAQQLYSTSQSWQRTQCTQMLDQLERERCLSNTSTPYETYKKQSEPADTRK
ncbi:hypothetical protein [Nitrosomonas sp.]|uniref:hypothetical protein n=1 Tax=Nitrosomonas sp. TaxID=42353 RepID=UPI001DF3D512|nr:hypothetical protein [Nitrosomonas sp.]MBX3615919.1 hypothetical protein [Nitrosomonas sp.]